MKHRVLSFHFFFAAFRHVAFPFPLRASRCHPLLLRLALAHRSFQRFVLFNQGCMNVRIDRLQRQQFPSRHFLVPCGSSHRSGRCRIRRTRRGGQCDQSLFDLFRGLSQVVELRIAVIVQQGLRQQLRFQSTDVVLGFFCPRFQRTMFLLQS